MSPRPRTASLPHRIRRVVFDLRLPDEKEAFRMRGQLEETLGSVVVPALERALDEYGSPGGERRLDRLVVDLGELPQQETLRAERYAAVVRAALQRALEEHPAREVRPDPRLRSLEETLSGFVLTGVLAWPTPFRTLDALEAALLELSTAEGERLADHLRSQLGASGPARRVAEQFSPAFVRRLVGWLRGGRAFAPGIPLERVPVRERAAALTAAAGAPWRPADGIPAPGAEGPGTGEMEARTSARTQRPARGPGPSGREAEPETGRRNATEPTAGQLEPPPGTPLQVAGAGIVLLHPFLPAFFRRLGLLDQAGARFATPGAAARAVHLLHHLVSGEEDPEEPAATLHKLLAGIRGAEPIPRRMPLDAAERLESTTLLRTAIGHWSSLGSTSPAGLREGFLLREGRLVETPERWELTVERRSIDVLLAAIPWSFSLVHLPWMPRPLHVHWA